MQAQHYQIFQFYQKRQTSVSLFEISLVLGIATNLGFKTIIQVE